jgi:hypothetical protein
VQRTVKGSVKAIRAAGDRVAVATSAGPIEMFTPAGVGLAPVAGNTGGTEAIALTPALLASGGQDRVIRLWKRDGDNFVAARALEGPRGDTHYVELDGDLLVTAGNDGQVLAWQVSGAAQPRVIAHHTGAVTALSVERDWIASAGRDATIARAPRGGGPTETVQLGAAAVALAVDDNGAVHAVTRAGGELRWARTAANVELEHGALGGVRLPGVPRWVVAFDDGALVTDLRAASFEELQQFVSATTTYALSGK